MEETFQILNTFSLFFLLELFIHIIINTIVTYYSVRTYSVHTCILERFVAEKRVSCIYSFDFPLG